MINKYRNQKVNQDGYTFASKLEAAIYNHLKLLERAKEYTDIKCQLQVRLGPSGIIYKPDFSAVNTKTGETEYFEAKGFKTNAWLMKRRLWKTYGPGLLHVYEGRHNMYKLKETIKPEPDKTTCPHCNKQF